jgi:type II secretory pathway component PulF
VRSGRDKAIYYRMWHLRQRAGLAWPDDPSPHATLPFETALVALGKESGKLEECVALLAAYFSEEDRVVLKVLKKAAYPMFLALAGALIGPLPLLAAGRWGAFLVVALGGLAAWALAGGSLLLGTVRWFLEQPRYVLDRLLRALTFAVEAGLSLGRAAALAAQASGDASVIAHVRRAGPAATAGQPLATTFAGCPHVPFAAIAAMEVADASGDYSGSLKKLADLYQG